MKDFWAEELQNQRKVKIRKVIKWILLFLILISVIVVICVYLFNAKFRQWCDKNVWKKEILQENTKYIDLDGDENTQVYAYDKYICVFRKKTLEFYNRAGNQVDKIDLNINRAVFATSGRYMAICEEDGQDFYLICGKEKIFENKIEGNISQINVNQNGYVSVVMSNASYKSIIDVFDKNGKEIFRTNLTSKAVDISISQDSKYLAIAEIDLSGIFIQSKIKIISIELAQTNSEEAIIYEYSAPTDKLIMNIEYQEQNNLICMYNDSIEILQEKNNSELLNIQNNKLIFMTIELSNKIALLEEVSTGEYTADTNIRFINPLTQKEIQYTVNDVAKSIATSENKIAINLGTELYIINKNGILLKKYISETEINDVVMTDGLVGIIYRDRIQIINL